MLMILFVLSSAFASTQEFTVSVGTQSCTMSQDMTVCSSTDYKSSREILELEGNKAWSKTFDRFHTQILVKKRPEHFLIRLNIHSLTGKSLGSFATEVKSLNDLGTLRLGSGALAISPEEEIRGWLRISL